MNRDPAIDVNVPDAASGQLRHDFRRRPRHMLHHSFGWSRSEPARAEHEHRLVAIRPRVKCQNRLVRLSADDQRIHRGHELIVAVGFATAWGQEIQITVGSSDESVDAGANKD